jgi:hypothetical protein
LSNPRKINKFAPKRIKLFDNVLKYPRKGLFYIGSYTIGIWYVCYRSRDFLNAFVIPLAKKRGIDKRIVIPL